MSNHENKKRPVAADVARRCLVLKYVVVSALTTPPRAMMEGMLTSMPQDQRQKLSTDATARQDAMQRKMMQQGLWEYVSPREEQILRATLVTMTQQQQIAASWRVEAAHVLMWALGLLDTLLPYDTSANGELMKEIPSSDVEGFIGSAGLRDAGEIEAARSVAEFWHWRSRTRQLIERGDAFPVSPQMKAKGIGSYDDIVGVSARRGAAEGLFPAVIDDDFPVNGKAYRALSPQEWARVRSITMERHFALNWLCGYAPDNRWDETPTGT